MHIRYHKRFEQRFHQLTPSIRSKVKITIQLFSESPTDPRLRNHALKGSLAGLHAISVTSNIRIIFEEQKNYSQVTMLDVGTHNQVY